MNYYERHLGDYAKDTAHLTMLEHGAYSLLLDRYYSTEQGIPADQAHRLARARSKEEKAAVDAVLSEFFTLSGDAWMNRRCDEEITKAQSKIKAAKENGKRGGRPKKEAERTEEKPTGLSVGSETGTQTKALQTPDTRHQEEIQPPTPSGVAPPCPAEPKGPRPSKKCPDSFAVTAEMRQWAQAEVPGIDVDLETSKLRDHTFGSARSDWLGTWRNWLRKAVEHQAQRRTTPAAAESFRERDERIAAESVRRLTGGLAHNRHATGEAPREVLPFEAGYVKPATTADTIEGDTNVRRIR